MSNKNENPAPVQNERTDSVTYNAANPDLCECTDYLLHKQLKQEIDDAERKIPPSDHMPIDWDLWKPFPPEFYHFMNQLYEMKMWFRKYGKAYDEVVGGELTACGVLDDLFSSCTHEISVLAGIEFIDAYFYKVDKRELVKHLKFKMP